MNTKIAIAVVVGITAAIIGTAAIASQQPDTMADVNPVNEEPGPDDDIELEIQDRLDEIEEKRLENEYSPKPREWITSGPFQIDRSEYVLGEKIFMRIGELGYQEKGQVVFLKPLNSTHNSVYRTVPFDGADNPAFNYYLQPQLSKSLGHCSVDDLVGDWVVVFRGTNYPSLAFEVTEQILPGEEEYYEPVC